MIRLGKTQHLHQVHIISNNFENKLNDMALREYLQRFYTLGPICVHVVYVFAKGIKNVRLINHIHDIYLGFQNVIR